MAPSFLSAQPTPLTVPTYLGPLAWDNNMILYQAAKLFPGDDSAVVKAAEIQAYSIVSPRLFPAAFLSMAVGTALTKDVGTGMETDLLLRFQLQPVDYFPHPIDKFRTVTLPLKIADTKPVMGT